MICFGVARRTWLARRNASRCDIREWMIAWTWIQFQAAKAPEIRTILVDARAWAVLYGIEKPVWCGIAKLYFCCLSDSEREIQIHNFSFPPLVFFFRMSVILFGLSGANFSFAIYIDTYGFPDDTWFNFHVDVRNWEIPQSLSPRSILKPFPSICLLRIY